MDISRLTFAFISAVFLYLSVSFLTATSVAAGSTIYTYTDDSGVLNFTTELHSIAEKYRSRVVPMNFETPLDTESPSPSAVPEAPPPSKNARTVTASGEYRLGNYDTRNDAVRLAIEAAKKDALEQVATYLESVSEVRNMDITRDDIRTYTAGIVKVLDQKITTKLEDDTVVVRAELTAQVDPNEVAQAIAALRANESAKGELLALRAETDQLQQQLAAANRALADAASPEQVHAASQQREEVLNELQANALVSQAWTSSVYMSPGLATYSWIEMPHINGLLLQTQGLYPRHRHLRRAQQFIAAQTGHMRATPPVVSSLPPHHSLLVPAPPGQLASPPSAHAVAPGSVGTIISAPTSTAVPPVPQPSLGSPPTHQLHPSHFWRPSPPNIHTSPPASQPGTFVSPPQFSGHGKQFGGGGHFRCGGGGGGRRGR